MKKWIIAAGAALVVLVGAYFVFRTPSAPVPEKTAAATSEDQGESEGSTDEQADKADNAAPADEQANAGAPAPEGAPVGETIVYQIQACVDEQATLALVGDKLQWSNLTGGGLTSDTCDKDFRGKTTVQVTHNGERGEPVTFDTTTPDVQFGPLPVPMPAKELAAPASVTFSSEARQGTVTVTGQPVVPWYRAQLTFNDPDGFAHQYTVRLTVTYPK